MAIRKNVKVFLDGCLQTVDLDEDGRVIGKKAVKKPQSDKKADKPPTKQELMATLKEMGVKFKATLSNKALQQIIDDQKSEPEATEPDEIPEASDNLGTGSQDVI